MSDVRPEQYPSVIRELIRHENDLTNHRIMWLLIGQGFLANAFVAEKDARTGSGLCVAGVVVSFSAFAMLYKSYRARGYLLMLGQKAKQGSLQEEHLPLIGWPRQRIEGWWKEVWICRWIARRGDMLEPWLLLPVLFNILWLTLMLQRQTALDPSVDLIMAVLLTSVLFVAYFIILDLLHSKDAAMLQKRAQDSQPSSNSR